MQRSSERILTSHNGSLPRPDDLVELPFRFDEDTLDNRAALDARVCPAVLEGVQAQLQHGLDVVNDGEVGKVGYATYITFAGRLGRATHRLTQVRCASRRRTHRIAGLVEMEPAQSQLGLDADTDRT
jgi:hypothetical protein